MVFGIDPKIFGDAVAEFLRARHPTKTAANVAADTGCTPAQVEKWLERASSPNGVALARLIHAYGPSFLSAVLPPSDWLDDARNRQQEGELLAERAAIEARIQAFRAAR